MFSNEAISSRKLLDQLLTDSMLYRKSQDYKNLLDFVSRMPHFAPFNAMLLQIQKPGLSFAASARDWLEIFGRKPKEEARPLLILWPFAPVVLVYDVQDTEGKDLPEDVYAFVAKGEIKEAQLLTFQEKLIKKGIKINFIDVGESKAGSIISVKNAQKKGETSEYKIKINKNHLPAVQFTTLVHELGHLYLGHLGPDLSLKLPDRSYIDKRHWELEAESVTYIVSCRNGVESKSKTYLANYVKNNTTIDDIDIYQIMRASGGIEKALGLSSQRVLESRASGGASIVKDGSDGQLQFTFF